MEEKNVSTSFSCVTKIKATCMRCIGPSAARLNHETQQRVRPGKAGGRGGACMYVLSSQALSAM